ncbi:MAG: KamA family radical SAM protein [Spirochaetaceae bacterium]|jgi:lysine 2,3-aminomutase|nr:KamA family radical SAM protein [Spirochaetaceae bacterium]
MSQVFITSWKELPEPLVSSVDAQEAAFIETLNASGGLPFMVSAHFAALAKPDKTDPIRQQFMPYPAEGVPDPFALADPLGEAKHQAAPRLVHQYRDRALLLAGGSCAGYCRYCFRRVWMSRPQHFISGEELLPVLVYLKGHPEIREILISGGDPLMAEDGTLATLFQSLRIARPGLLLRICTRLPITQPSRLTLETVRLFRAYRPLRMVIQSNHPRELAAGTQEALRTCVDQGIPVHVQTVLLRGINDDAQVLAALFRECLQLGLSPYYLFQLDLAPGTAHFRVPLKTGLALYEELKRHISGLGLPVYALDLPGGGGKIPLHQGVIAGEQVDSQGLVYLLQGPEGKLWPYPA